MQEECAHYLAAGDDIGGWGWLVDLPPLEARTPDHVNLILPDSFSFWELGASGRRKVAAAFPLFLGLSNAGASHSCHGVCAAKDRAQAQRAWLLWRDPRDVIEGFGRAGANFLSG